MMMIGYWPQLIYDASNILLSTFYEFASPRKNSVRDRPFLLPIHKWEHKGWQRFNILLKVTQLEVAESQLLATTVLLNAITLYYTHHLLKKLNEL